ncbi:kinase-like domain-containing protein [Hyaloraphidium curvatum]|nr:kinase-like domain-containing protein [Hyaloraphidium curvatum]
MDGRAPEARYTFHEPLGQGAFGEVWRATENSSGDPVAVKIIDLAECDDDIEEVQKEIQILRACSSEYVPKFIDSFLTGEKLWIVMELMTGGSCGDILQTHTFEEDHIAVILKDVLEGLKYLHSTGKIHRDIKAANILLSESGKVKLADFGVAGQLQSMRISKTHTTVGTPNWMAPEVILGSGHDTKADIWSLGITAIELAKGQPPHSGKHPLQIFKMIPTSPPPELTGTFSPELKDFVHKCLRKNPRERPTAAALLDHPFVATALPTGCLSDLVSASRSAREEKLRTKAKGKARKSAP